MSTINSLIAQLEADQELGVFAYRGDIYVYGDTTMVGPDTLSALRTHKGTLVQHLSERRPLFEMNVFQRSMVIHELVTGDRAANSMFYPLPNSSDVSTSEMKDAVVALQRLHPLLSSKVIHENDRFFFELVEGGFDPIIEDAEPCTDVEALSLRYLHREQSLFEAGPLRLIRSRVAGRVFWGVWLHHIIADAPFAERILTTLARLIDGDTRPVVEAPDFDFLQQNWQLRQLSRDRGCHARAFWADFATALPEERAVASDLPVQEDVTCIDLSVPAVLARPQRNPKEPVASALTYLVLALAASLEPLIGQKFAVALGTFSQRNVALGANSSGFYTNLAPFGLSPTADPPGRAATAALDGTLRRIGAHSYLPLEDILETTAIGRGEPVALVNVVQIGVSAPAAVLETPAVRKVRCPITVTVLCRGEAWSRLILSGTLPEASLRDLGVRLTASLVFAAEEHSS